MEDSQFLLDLVEIVSLLIMDRNWVGEPDIRCASFLGNCQTLGDRTEIAIPLKDIVLHNIVFNLSDRTSDLDLLLMMSHLRSRPGDIFLQGPIALSVGVLVAKYMVLDL